MTNPNKVDPQLLELLCCPACRGDLAYFPERSEMWCQPCGHTYPVIDGIPVLFPTDVKAQYNELFGRYWDSEERAEIYDRFVEGHESLMDLHHHRGEVRATMAVIGELSPCKLLDCGCGNGRFFEVYPSDVFAVGVDASLNLLRICKHKDRCSRLVCGELEHLPFKDEAFDRTVSVRVMQHIHEQRVAVREMVRTLKVGGETILHCYNDLSSKALVKQVRESRLAPILNAPFRALFRSMSPFGPWDIPYDKYSTVAQIRGWLRAEGLSIAVVRGSGFGFNKWLVDGFMLGPWLEKHSPKILEGYLRASKRAEETLGTYAPFNRVMEKFVIKGVKAGG